MNRNQISVDTFNKLAEQYQEKYMSLELYAKTFDSFCDLVKKQNAQILELACGPGNITQYLLEKRPDFKILATDLAPKMIELAIRNNPDAEFQILDCRDIGTLMTKYDAIMCGFCLPYLSKAETANLIENAATILLPRGVIYLSFMEDDYDRSGLQSSSSGDEVYIYYHEEKSVTKMLKESGFKIEHLQRKNHLEQDDSTTVDCFITAQLQ